MHVYGELSGVLTPAGTLSGKLSTPKSIIGQITAPLYVYPPVYTGNYEVTPSDTEQVLETDAFYMNGNVTINPIPSNYGLITWNGSTLTVS
ncbi:MAG: hypothetical protein IJH28_05475 [Mogibacterium sp.]|nr:hypothetical protein [Mogibacterium sp.]